MQARGLDEFLLRGKFEICDIRHLRRPEDFENLDALKAAQNIGVVCVVRQIEKVQVETALFRRKVVQLLKNVVDCLRNQAG